MQLYERLGIPCGVTAVIGSGGKTTLLRTLSRELPGTVILTTTTHILPFEGVPLLTAPTEDEVRAALARSRVLCLGHAGPRGQADRPFPAVFPARAACGLCARRGRRLAPTPPQGARAA